MLELALKSLLRTNLIGALIVVIQAPDIHDYKKYVHVIKNLSDRCDVEVLAKFHKIRLGSANARNRILYIASQTFSKRDILVLYDDDFICPSKDSLLPVIEWLSQDYIGLVGGKVINLFRRAIDPDVYLNLMPYLAEVLSTLTGFVFIDTKHGPRYANYTPNLLALRVKLASLIRYDPNYRGTGYREESDLQEQVRRLGYKIIFDPRFYVYHMNVSYGGNRDIDSLPLRFYWKARNNTYFVIKNEKGTLRLVLSNAIISAYAMLHGIRCLKAVTQGLRDILSMMNIRS